MPRGSVQLVLRCSLRYPVNIAFLVRLVSLVLHHDGVGSPDPANIFMGISVANSTVRTKVEAIYLRLNRKNCIKMVYTYHI